MGNSKLYSGKTTLPNIESTSSEMIFHLFIIALTAGTCVGNAMEEERLSSDEIRNATYYELKHQYSSSIKTIVHSTVQSPCVVIQHDNDGASGYMETPNFPYGYAANIRCYWSLEVPQGKVIHVLISDGDFDMESTRDYLEIYDGPTYSSHQLATVSGTPGYLHYQSSDSYLTFFLETSSTNTGQGFFIRYQEAPAQ